jgi:L-lactate permease
MAVKSSGIDSRLALPGLTVMLALFAFWLGTRRPGILQNFPSSESGSVVMTGAVLFVAFWLGCRNPDVFGALPIIGKAAD